MPKNKKRSSGASRSLRKDEPARAADAPDRDSADLTTRAWPWLLGLALVLFAWSYWPVLVSLVGEWTRVADYSHGFLVIPLAAWFLWIHREDYPGTQAGIAWGGLLLIAIAAALRLVGSYYYLEALHGWSIPFWVGGVIWTFFGWPAFRWAAPALGFLFFMVPLPYSVENMLAVPLQQISTKVSVFVMQCLMVPAVAQGNQILIAGVEQPLEVARACSGIRIFFGIAGLCYAFLLLFPRPLATKILLVGSILPIALAANSLRIVVLGLMRRMDLNEVGDILAHDAAGLFMIPIAAGLFFLLLKFLDALFPIIDSVDASQMIRQQTRRSTS